MRLERFGPTDSLLDAKKSGSIEKQADSSGATGKEDGVVSIFYIFKSFLIMAFLFRILRQRLVWQDLGLEAWTVKSFRNDSSAFPQIQMSRNQRLFGFFSNSRQYFCFRISKGTAIRRK